MRTAGMSMTGPHKSGERLDIEGWTTSACTCSFEVTKYREGTDSAIRSLL